MFINLHFIISRIREAILWRAHKNVRHVGDAAGFNNYGHFARLLHFSTLVENFVLILFAIFKELWALWEKKYRYENEIRVIFVSLRVCLLILIITIRLYKVMLSFFVEFQSGVTCSILFKIMHQIWIHLFFGTLCIVKNIFFYLVSSFSFGRTRK